MLEWVVVEGCYHPLEGRVQDAATMFGKAQAIKNHLGTNASSDQAEKSDPFIPYHPD